MDLKRIIIKIKEDFFLKAFNESNFDLKIMKLFNFFFELLISNFDERLLIGGNK